MLRLDEVGCARWTKIHPYLSILFVHFSQTYVNFLNYAGILKGLVEYNN